VPAGVIGGTPPPEGALSVQWEDYAASLKARIDVARKAKDCTKLQAEFDTADANNAATMERTGHNDAQLMAYIDAAMRIADCY
jgi:hypothetical protein